jgi:hypothetical protein
LIANADMIEVGGGRRLTHGTSLRHSQAHSERDHAKSFPPDGSGEVFTRSIRVVVLISHPTPFSTIGKSHVHLRSSIYQKPTYMQGSPSRLERGGDDISANSSLPRRRCDRALALNRAVDGRGCTRRLAPTFACFGRRKKKSPRTLCFLHAASL